MQVYSISKQHNKKTILFFLLVMLLAYLPVSSFLFFLKNDAFTGYFPPKFFMSESLHAGRLPLWNPYINFGIPQYADMSSGYWSPVTWLIAATVGYNAYTFTLELLLYLLLGGIGYYKMMQYWVENRTIQVICGVAFMCCGFNVGHLQHFNWVSGAALLPWCIHSYLLLLEKFTFRRSLICGLLLYVFISSAHPGLTISAIYFLIFLFIYYLLNKKDKSGIIINFTKTHLVLFFLIMLLSAGMISAYLDFLPHFVRGEKLSLGNSLSNPTTLPCWISTILPFAVTKNELLFNTDISMRNSYFGITPFIFVLFALIGKKTRWQYFFLFTGIFFMLLSTGGVFKTIAHKYFPLMGYIRLNGEFRIFSILSFLIVSGIGLQQFMDESTGKDKPSSNENDINKRPDYLIRWISRAIGLVLTGCIIIGLYHSINNQEGILFLKKNVLPTQSTASFLKLIIDQISFYDTLWIQGLIQSFFLWGILSALKKSNWKRLEVLTVTNLMLCCLMNIPYTGVGQAPLSQVQRVLDKSPKGLPVPALVPIKNYDTISIEEKGLVGDWSMYSKQPGVCKEVDYPIRLKKMAAYFKKNDKDENVQYLDYPFVFLLPQNQSDKLSVTAFYPDSISIIVNTKTASAVVLQQSYYPHWFYRTSGKTKAVELAGVSFMRAPVNENKERIIFYFDPSLVKWMMLLSLIALMASLMVLLIPQTK